MYVSLDFKVKVDRCFIYTSIQNIVFNIVKTYNVYRCTCYIRLVCTFHFQGKDCVCKTIPWSHVRTAT